MRSCRISPLIPVPSYLVWVIWVFPSYVEHVPNLLSQADPGPAVGSHIDPGDAVCSSKLWSPQEQNVLLRPKRTYSVCNVIANDNDVTAFWILRGLQSHLPGHHSNLQPKSREQQKLNVCLQDVKEGNHGGAIFIICVVLWVFSLGTPQAALLHCQGKSTAGRTRSFPHSLEHIRHRSLPTQDTNTGPPSPHSGICHRSKTHSANAPLGGCCTYFVCQSSRGENGRAAVQNSWPSA